MAAMLLVFIFAVLSHASAQVSPAPAPVTLYQRPINSDCVQQNGASSTVDYFPNQLQITGNSGNTPNQTEVTVAQDFSVQYFDTYKVISNSFVNETYVLYQCGTGAPSGNALPAGAKMFSIPLTSASILETVPIAFLELLGVMDRVQSVSSSAVSSCGQALLACNRTAPDSFSDSESAIQAQLLPVTDAIVSSSATSNALTTFAFSASQDPGALKRAEWIKFLGMFFNLDASAAATFNSVNSLYYQTAANISSRTNSSSNKPVLAFTQYYSYSPYSAYEISIVAYKAQYAKDSGAQNLNVSQLLAINGTILSPNDPTNQTVWFAWNMSGMAFPSQSAAATAYQNVIRNVDILIDETYALNPTTYNTSTFLQNFNISSGSAQNFTFLAKKSLYREDRLCSPAPAYGLDWFEGAIARPDRVLLDFADAVDPSAYPNYTRVWLRNISLNETVNIITSSQCNQLTQCSSQPETPICPLISTCGNGRVVPQQNATSICQYAACTS